MRVDDAFPVSPVLVAAAVVVVPVVEAPQSVEAAMAAGAAPIERCGERIARLVSIGIGFGSRGAGPGKGARSP